MSEQPANDDPLEVATQKILDTAKWLLITLAAVGAVMTAGLQLTSIGTLDVPESMQWFSNNRLFVAVGGFIVGVLGVVSAISLIARVFAPTSVSLESLKRAEQTNRVTPIKSYIKEAGVLYEYDDSATIFLRNAHDTLQARTDAENLANQLEAENRPQSEINNAIRTFNNRNNEVVYHQLKARRLFTALRYYSVKKRFNGVSWWVILSAIIAALGIGALSWAVNPPEEPLNPAPYQMPTLGTLTLTPLRAQMIAEQIGDACLDVNRQLQVIVLSTTEDGEADVVSLPSDTCNVTRFTVNDTSWGRLLPSQTAR